MVKAFYKEELIDLLASLISFGFYNKYSFSYMEDRISNSSFINALENAEFDINTSKNDLIKEIYQVGCVSELEPSIKTLFIAEAYLYIFLKII